MNHKGFTVLELIVVIGIITILMSVFLVNFRDFDRKATLENEVEKITSILKEAQLYALIGQTIGGVRYNYGLQISECTAGDCNFYLFKDDQTSGDKIYDNGEEMTAGDYVLSSSVQVISVSPDISNELSVIFEAPLGGVYFNGLQTDDEATIVLEEKDSGAQKVIRINRVSGRVNIE